MTAPCIGTSTFSIDDHAKLTGALSPVACRTPQSQSDKDFKEANQ
jgi:hypothetical protein